MLRLGLHVMNSSPPILVLLWFPSVDVVGNSVCTPLLRSLAHLELTLLTCGTACLSLPSAVSDSAPSRDVFVTQRPCSKFSHTAESHHSPLHWWNTRPELYHLTFRMLSSSQCPRRQTIFVNSWLGKGASCVYHLQNYD